MFDECLYPAISRGGISSAHAGGTGCQGVKNTHATIRMLVAGAGEGMSAFDACSSSGRKTKNQGEMNEEQE
jgi:succinyl-CoA synthetase beta subunit